AYEDIRLDQQSRVEEGVSRFAHPAAVRQILAAFQPLGIEATATAPASAAARIQSRPPATREQLLAALYECLFYTPAKDTALRPWLVAVLGAADADRWRAAFRQAVLTEDLKAMEALVGAVDVRQQPVNILIALGKMLLPVAPRTSMGLFRRVHRAHEADLW